MGVLRIAGRRVLVARTSELHFVRERDICGRYRLYFEDIVNGLEPWEDGDIVVETVEFDEASFPSPVVEWTAVSSDIRRMFWALNRSHTALQPGLSPFVEFIGQPPRTNALTVEFAGTYDRPIIARIYPGEEMMPLPWQSSVRKYGTEQDRHDAATYWSNHAFVAMGNFCRDTVSTAPPRWFCESL